MKQYRFDFTKRPTPTGKAVIIGRRAEIFEDAVSFPNTVSYEDIDNTVIEWVNQKLELEYDGKILPTYKLFSIQRIGEYGQTWSNKDNNGNVIMNFKTVTRENNPKRGTIYGGIYNIPGQREYVLGYRANREAENLIGYDVYTMKQPESVDLTYKVGVITNKLELLNKFNTTIQERFRSITEYIFPHGHPMSMILDDISDNSEYSMQDRKFYSQICTITVRAYIITENNFNVRHMPVRVNYFINNQMQAVKGIDKIEFKDMCDCEKGEDNNLEPKRYTIDITQSRCEGPIVFKYNFGKSLLVTDIETDNIDKIEVFINEGLSDFDEDVVFYEGDTIRIAFTIIDLRKPVHVTIVGEDYQDMIDPTVIPESEEDDVETDITVKDPQKKQDKGNE